MLFLIIITGWGWFLPALIFLLFTCSGLISGTDTSPKNTSEVDDRQLPTTTTEEQILLEIRRLELLRDLKNIELKNNENKEEKSKSKRKIKIVTLFAGLVSSIFTHNPLPLMLSLLGWPTDEDPQESNN